MSCCEKISAEVELEEVWRYSSTLWKRCLLVGKALIKHGEDNDSKTITGTVMKAGWWHGDKHVVSFLYPETPSAGCCGGAGHAGIGNTNTSFCDGLLACIVCIVLSVWSIATVQWVMVDGADRGVSRLLKLFFHMTPPAHSLTGGGFCSC